MTSFNPKKVLAELEVQKNKKEPVVCISIPIEYKEKYDEKVGSSSKFDQLIDQYIMKFLNNELYYHRGPYRV